MPLEGIRRLALGNLDDNALRDLIAEEEHLFVERKREPPPAPRFGEVVASFANTLGGWLLIGVENDGSITGWKPPRGADLQSHLGQVLRRQVDPLPPYVAAARELDGNPIAVMRVFESADTPHIVRRTGAVYTRTSKGKEPVADQAVLFQLARRGEDARREAQRRLGGLDLVWNVTRPPERNEPVSEITTHVRASPYTVTPQFSDWAISEAAAVTIFDTLATNLRFSDQRVLLEPYGRGVAAIAHERTIHHDRHATLVIDAGGVIAARLARPGNEDDVRFDPPELRLVTRDLQALVSAVGTILAAAEAYGRVAWDMISSRPLELKLYGGTRNPPNHLHASADSVAPFDDADLDEIVSLLTRELGREAGNPEWEPPPREPETEEPA